MDKQPEIKIFTPSLRVIVPTTLTVAVVAVVVILTQPFAVSLVLYAAAATIGATGAVNVAIKWGRWKLEQRREIAKIELIEAQVVKLEYEAVRILVPQGHNVFIHDDNLPRLVEGQATPQAPRALEPVTVNVQDERGRLAAMHRLELGDIDDARLAQFAAGVVGGKRLTLGTWTGEGGLFSRAEFELLMAEMDRAGLVRWRNEAAPAQGREPTTSGKTALRRWAEYV